MVSKRGDRISDDEEKLKGKNGTRNSEKNVQKYRKKKEEFIYFFHINTCGLPLGTVVFIFCVLLCSFVYAVPFSNNLFSV